VLVPNTEALMFNVTGVQPTGSTYLKVWPQGYSDIPQPGISNLNLGQGQIVSNAVLSLIGPTQKFNIYNSAYQTHLVADVVGRFFSNPPPVPAGAKATAAVVGGYRLRDRPQATLLRD
jgi:hypothetical protein